MDVPSPVATPTALLPAPTEAGLDALLLHLEVLSALLFDPVPVGIDRAA